jgi:hypothetical protein
MPLTREVYNVDFSMVQISFRGIPLSGFSEGADSIQVERDDDSFEKKAGGDGITTRVKKLNKGGSIKLKLQQSSPSNDVLSAAHKADDLTGTGAGALSITDLSGRTVIVTATAWVKKLASVSLGNQMSDREWTLDCANIEMNVAGNTSVFS